MSRYLSHLAALTLSRVEPVQPRLASRFETPVDRSPSGNNGLDVAQESRVFVPPARVQPSTVTATDGSARVERVQPRLSSWFETPVDKGSSDNNGLDVAQETRVSAPPAHIQTSMVTATDRPVAQKVATASADGQAKKESSGQDQPKLVEHTEFIIKKSESPGDQQKLSSGQSFASFNSKVNSEQTNRAAQSVNKPVAQTPYEIRRKDTLPTENIHTLVERVQARFTETTHSEFIIREVAAPDANQKISKLEESPRPAPVKPASIVVRSEQSTVGPITPSRAGAQQISSDHYGTDAIPAPTIHVTIGRIEVRATQAAEKPAVKPRAARNTMSLDDYLNRRNGGKS